MKERIAKWIFNDKTSVLSLFDARVFDTKSQNNKPFEEVDLNEIPYWEELPEYAKFALQFGIRQGASDSWGSSELSSDQKLEGMASDLRDYQRATFARAKTEKGETISLNKIKSQVWSLQELRLMKEMFPKIDKIFPLEMEAKLEELEAIAITSEKKAKIKN